MVEINASAWADWDEMFDYIREMKRINLKVRIINASILLEVWHKEELIELGFIK
jgi:hypothetical protein